jgi:hypothetical protein
MKRLLAAFAFLLLSLSYASAVGCTGTGSCFWEGGTGNWSDTTKWCTTNTNPCTGTTGGLPGSGDNCNFTSVSNATAYTVTLDQAATCKDMTWALPGTSGVPTFANAGFGVNIFGSLTLITGMSVTAASGLTWTFQATTTGKTVTSNGVVFPAFVSITFNGSGGGWTLQDAMSIDSGRTLTVSQGTLNTNAKTVTTGFFVSTSGTRTLTLDNSTINITGTSGTVWNINASGLTFSATGSTINVNGGTANTSITIVPGSVTYNNFNITAVGAPGYQGGSTVKNFSYTSTTDKRDNLNFSGTLTIAASGSLTIAGNSTVNRAFVTANVLGSQKTISVPNTATVSLTNVDFQDIASAGTFGTWTGTSLGDCLGNSGITFDPSVSLTWDTSKTGAQNWSGSNWLGTTNRVPLPQDDVALPSLSVATTITQDMPRMGRNINEANFNRTLAGGGVTTNNFGNLTWGASSTFSGPNTHAIGGRGTQTLTSNGKQLGFSLTINAIGGSYTLQDDLTSTSTFNHQAGTFADGGHNLSGINWSSPGALTRAVSGSGTWSFNTTTGAPWTASGSGLTTTGFTGTMKFTGNVATSITFNGNGLVYPTIFWSNTASTGTLIITGANTFADIQTDSSTARTIQFPASTTTTVSAFSAKGAPSKQLTLNSSSAGTQATLRGVAPIKTAYVRVQDILVQPKGCAGLGSTNVSNNTGWKFGACGGSNNLLPAISGPTPPLDLNYKDGLGRVELKPDNDNVIRRRLAS